MKKGPPGLILGQKGVKYGLQTAQARAQAASKAPARPPAGAANVFGMDSDDEDDVGTQIAKQAEKKRAAAKVQAMYEQALTEDPTIFDYDGVYDNMQAAVVQPKQQDKIERKSKYIASLKDHAESRKREQEVLFERKMVKDRQQEDHLFEDKEKFVTSAYRKKLEEDKKWLEQEKIKELEEERNDVRKVGHLGNFYRNLLTSNVAFGAKNQEVGKAKDGEGKDPGASEAGEDGEASTGQRAEDDGAGAGPGSAKDGQRSGSAEAQAIPHKLLAAMDQYDRLRLQAERTYRSAKAASAVRSTSPAAVASGAEDQGAAGGTGREDEWSGAGTSQPLLGAPDKKNDDKSRDSSKAVAAAAAEAAAVAEAAAAVTGGKRRNDDSSVVSARERYLARKAQKT